MNFPFITQVTVRFRDVDAMGHVNNAVYFTYLESARTEFFAELLEIESPGDLPVILAEATCRFRAPVFFREKLNVGMGVSRWGNKSFDLVYEITAEDGRVVATARTVMVMYDYQQEKTFPVPEALRQKIDQYQQGWQAPAW